MNLSSLVNETRNQPDTFVENEKKEEEDSTEVDKNHDSK